MPETTFGLFTAPESRTMQRGLGFTDPEPDRPRQSLAERYRPRYLADLVGQGNAVVRLMDFVDAPYSSAWILAGPTGVGKTSAALALANELGIDRNWGLHHLKSGDGQDEHLSHALDLMRYYCPAGSGWKMLLIDEADMMSPKAKGRCLSALESLPERSVVVFTTNEPEKFAARFRDRCEVVYFQGDPDALALDCQALFDDLWRREALPGEPWPVSSLPGLVADGAVSFRRVVRFVEQIKGGWKPSTVPTPAASPRRRTASA